MGGPVRIVREPELPRIAAAARAVRTEMIRPRPSGQCTDDVLASAFASRALAADDDHGRAAGVVVQADGLRWDELDAFADMAGPLLDTDHHAGLGNWHPRCPMCVAIGAHQRIVSHRRYLTVGPTTPSDD